jgi:hypothetical protein
MRLFYLLADWFWLLFVGIVNGAASRRIRELTDANQQHVSTIRLHELELKHMAEMLTHLRAEVDASLAVATARREQALGKPPQGPVR